MQRPAPSAPGHPRHRAEAAHNEGRTRRQRARMASVLGRAAGRSSVVPVAPESAPLPNRLPLPANLFEPLTPEGKEYHTSKLSPGQALTLNRSKPYVSAERMQSLLGLNVSVLAIVELPRHPLAGSTDEADGIEPGTRQKLNRVYILDGGVSADDNATPAIWLVGHEHLEQMAAFARSGDDSMRPRTGFEVAEVLLGDTQSVGQDEARGAWMPVPATAIAQNPRIPDNLYGATVAGNEFEVSVLGTQNVQLAQMGRNGITVLSGISSYKLVQPPIEYRPRVDPWPHALVDPNEESYVL